MLSNCKNYGKKKHSNEKTKIDFGSLSYSKLGQNIVFTPFLEI